MPLPDRNPAPPRRLLGDSVYDRLFEAITLGELTPGEVLRDADLIEWLGVSRSPIRDALKRLSDDGLVEFVPHRFTRVTPIDPRQQLEIALTLYALYELSLAVGTPKLGAKDRTALTRISARIAAAGERGDGPALGTELHAYCLALAERSGNRLLLEQLAQQAAKLRLLVAGETALADPAGAAVILAEVHRAVLAGDVSAATQAHREFTAAGRRSFREQAGHVSAA